MEEHKKIIKLLAAIVILLIVGAGLMFITDYLKDTDPEKLILDEKNNGKQQEEMVDWSGVSNKEDISCYCDMQTEGVCGDCQVLLNNKIFSIYRTDQEKQFRDAQMNVIDFNSKTQSEEFVLINNLILGTEMTTLPNEWSPNMNIMGDYIVWHDGGVGIGGGGSMSNDYIINTNTLDVYRIIYMNGSSIKIEKINNKGDIIDSTYIGFNIMNKDLTPINNQGLIDGNEYIFDSLIVNDSKIELPKQVEWTEPFYELDYFGFHSPVLLYIDDFYMNFIIFHINKIDGINDMKFKYDVENNVLYDGSENKIDLEVI